MGRWWLLLLCVLNCACSVSFSAKATLFAPLNREVKPSDASATNSMVIAKSLLDSGQTDDAVATTLKAAGLPEAEAQRIIALAKSLLAGGKP